MTRALRCALALVVLSAARLSAQGGFLWQGVATAEGWKTDSASLLLARGSGHPSVLGRLDTWAAFEPIENLIAFGELFSEGGAAREEAGNDTYMKQYGLRFTPSDAFTLSAGKITQVVGTFSERQLATRNPLIGTPDGYAASYPNGARVDGTLGSVDYRAGMLSLPVWRPGYTPEPSSSWHPAAGFGITPMTGLRIGMSGTWGPYLNDGYTTAQLKGLDWTKYNELIVATDVQFSRGYFEAHFEGARSTYDIPGRETTQDGLQFYVESKYTLTPRLFVAARYERNDYPFIAAFGPNWVASNSVVSDGEFGGGFRPTATTLLKVSLRKDHWKPNPNPSAPHDNGYGLALQLSQSFDLMELFTRER